MDLLARTKELAATVPFERAAVCREVGVTPRWLLKVMKGEIPEPSVVKIQRLHDVLAGLAGNRAA